ncbi:MAG: hypothetical protein AAGE59_23440 [Cyanobacteria bacterium P01_F01_bin.86]
MNLDELKVHLNQIAWEEQVNFEISERYSEANDNDAAVEESLRSLGHQLTPSMLDELQQDCGYITWALRLSPFVPNDKSRQRTHSFITHQKSQVRYWANVLLDAK